MNLKVQIILLLTFGLATMSTAQENQYSFYKAQAQSDAKYEQSFVVVSAEDEKDYWEDQERYERDLKNQNSEAYNVYMNEKRSAYTKHAQLCKDLCTHSDYFYQQASFYFMYKDNENNSKEAFGSIVQVASPRIF
ncbi:hypothetical protein [Allomuricauda sp. F6463D]|uniref:hypothetical protein n=1 Tax=Allomuricauda sp. F6463D TaxID=2926409 RepID=UPI001FF36D7C|nr:hypothetical protein [Muricauda sp. F6463D]MCK0160931.1 hypothetical protein [Muricauda sp. F6463D]